MTMKPDFFERLLLLPLFQGIGRNEFLEIAERIRIGFQKKAKDVEFICQDSFCDSLYFVLDGELCARRVSDDRNYVFFEWMNLPMVIQPECLFGLRTRYSRSFQATGTVYLFELKKAFDYCFLPFSLIFYLIGIAHQYCSLFCLQIGDYLLIHQIRLDLFDY